MRKKNHFVNGETTIIGEGSVLDGNFKTTASTRIDGIINGDVSSDGVIVVGNTGKINGNVVALELRSAGDIKGNVKAPDRIELLGKASLYGDIETKSLAIEDQAIFQGNCLMDTNVMNANSVNSSENTVTEEKKDVKEENNNLEEEKKTDDSEK